MRIENNMILVKEFTVNLATFTETTRFIIKGVRENYKYVDKKKTDEFISTSLTLVDPDTYEFITVKCPQKLELTQADIDGSEELFLAEIDIENTMIYPYKIEYGKAKVSIIAPAVKILRAE